MLIQKLRLQRGWSQQQLADLSGLSVRTIQRLEQGQVASTESLKSLAAVFEIDFSTLQEPDMNTATAPTTPHAFDAEEALAFAQVRKLKGFYLHLAQYLIVVTLLLGINLWTHPQYLWVGWVAMGWGIGVLFHGLRVFERFSPFGADWEKKEVEKRLGRKI
ncbi:XRE family transcriptional regulator [Limnohabitans sp. Jir61]|uniref:helix-turn-helix domain-containing protein n=1 Tax=Limnohabitans sp. Jir61 TaxID=1826168 RepID=UPI000D375EB2|nr:helix-turn-helix domain-containing protein [Limnohabitans sp. Jir61]PUE32504.1 XRE family transcriptional regulator [Limnohabitans sp. Jir61]